MNQDTAAPPQPEPGASDRYLLRDPERVRALLLTLIDRRCMVTIACAGDHPAAPGVVSALLGLDGGWLWADAPRDAARLRQLLHARRLAFETRLDRVDVRFGAGPPEQAGWEGRPALRVPLPRQVLYLQRRELMRREPPPGVLRCVVPATSPEGAPVEASIRDIGGGGLAVLVPEAAMPLRVGDVLHGCRIELPGMEALRVDLQVCHLREVPRGGATTQQAGCRFVGLPDAAQARLFRYLMQLDREHLARR